MLLISMVNKIISDKAVKSIRSRGFVRGNFDPIDIVDSVNVLFLGPNAALSARNRKIAQKDFSDQLGSFGGDFNRFSVSRKGVFDF